MSLPAVQSPILDLAAPLRRERWPEVPQGSNAGLLKWIEKLAAELNPVHRSSLLIDVLKRVGTPGAVELIRTGAALANGSDPAGRTLLFTFLETRPSGIEVLEHLGGLGSLERVTLKIAGGSWADYEESEQVRTFLEILGVLSTAAGAGAMDVGPVLLPMKPIVIKSLLTHLRSWFRQSVARLAAGERLPEPSLQFLSELARLEVNLIEQRAGRLARTMDPGNARVLHRMVTALNCHRLDLAHMRAALDDVPACLNLRERRLTIEAGLSAERVDRLRNGLAMDPASAGLARILDLARSRLLADRELAGLVCLVHHLARLRCQAIGAEPPPFLGTVLGVLETARSGLPLVVRVESRVALTIGDRAAGPGVTMRSRGCFELSCFDEALSFLNPDGTPRVDDNPLEPPRTGISFKDLVRMNMTSDSFLLGVLSNERAWSVPGIVALIATCSRSPRVLETIAATRDLHTGPANHDVPRLLLMNPAHVPLKILLPLIHVRFVSRLDLERLERSRGEVRREVRTEIQAYMRTIRE